VKSPIHLAAFSLRKGRRKEKAPKRNAEKDFAVATATQGSALRIRKLLKKLDQNFNKRF